MTTKSTKNWALDTAVSVHNENADWFSEQYQKSKDRYASEFIYGRKKMDFYFERELKKLPKGAKILDVGCGTGHQMSDLLQQGFEVLGIEPADNMRAYAQSHLSDKAVLNASVKKLPFESETFDFVYAFEVFRYLNYEDNLLGLAEIRRVLKKGGVFFGSFVNLYALDGYTVLVGIRRLQHVKALSQIKHCWLFGGRKLWGYVCAHPNSL